MSLAGELQRKPTTTFDLPPSLGPVGLAVAIGLVYFVAARKPTTVRRRAGP